MNIGEDGIGLFDGTRLISTQGQLVHAPQQECVSLGMKQMQVLKAPLNEVFKWGMVGWGEAA